MDGSVTILPWATKENRLVYNIKHVAIIFKIPINMNSIYITGEFHSKFPRESVKIRRHPMYPIQDYLVLTSVKSDRHDR